MSIGLLQQVRLVTINLVAGINLSSRRFEDKPFHRVSWLLYSYKTSSLFVVMTIVCPYQTHKQGGIPYGLMRRLFSGSSRINHQTSLSSAMQPTTFLAIPREIRQRILLLTYDPDEPLTPINDDHKEKHVQTVRDWILTINLVHSKIVGDMKYVKKIWWDAHCAMWNKQMASFMELWDRASEVLFASLTDRHSDSVKTRKKAYKKSYTVFSEFMRLRYDKSVPEVTCEERNDYGYHIIKDMYLAVGSPETGEKIRFSPRPRTRKIYGSS